MPIKGQLTDKCRRALENLAVSGPSTTVELDALDPTAPAHKDTIGMLRQAGYVVGEERLDHKQLTRYVLTAKAKTLLYGTNVEPVPTPPKPTSTQAKRYERNQTALRNITPPITHGSLSTARMQNACADMLAPATRSGAEQALQVPSRVNDVLCYRDGRRVDVKATATP